MALIKSISGIRGTIGGAVQEGLNPLSTVRFVSAYASFIQKNSGLSRPRIVVGRDARISGPMLKQLVLGTLCGMGCDVLDIDLATTPTTELAVTHFHADGGIILTASHNPRQWNALKLLTSTGEFLDAKQGAEVLALAERDEFSFAEVDQLGRIEEYKNFLDEHIRQILALDIVDAESIRSAGFAVAIDAVNSVGGVAIPRLLEALGVEVIYPLNCEPDGEFAHNPEPLPHHLTEICSLVAERKADLGVVVDPDVDRLALIDENGAFVGEEYTLVAVAEYLLSQFPGKNTVSNLSSTRALRDITEQYGGHYYASAVGEVNVVAKMKEVKALIGGEGNGGVIYPALHYGRDALVGVAIILTMMAKRKQNMSSIRATLPQYAMSKQRVEVPQSKDTQALLDKLAKDMSEHNPTLTDGVKIDFADSWVHVRRSNTEPIIRIYTEAPTQGQADRLALDFVDRIQTLVK